MGSKEESSFSEEKEAKRLLLVGRGVTFFGGKLMRVAPFDLK
jgi:hypothetical protein